MINIHIDKSVGLLYKFAEAIDVPVEKGLIRIPEGKGSGYLKGVRLGEGAGLMIRNYEFFDDLLISRRGDEAATNRVIFSFNNVFVDGEDLAKKQVLTELPSVQINKGKIDTERLLPKKVKNRSILLALDIRWLNELLGEQRDNPVYTYIVQSEQDLVFEEVITPGIQKVANEIIACAVPESLENVYYRLKTGEIICLLFAELLKRESAPVQALNENDVLVLYLIRDQILQNLDKPPVLSVLAQQAGMSESKLKRLFKQIFGNSLFHYYQSFRMKEAARLLKENKRSVSGVGYELGFSNLSHFSKVFEEHLGVKPKRFQLGF